MNFESGSFLDPLYDAPFDWKGWSLFLSRLEGVLPGSAVVLWLPFPDLRGSGIGVAPSLDPGAVSEYARDHVAADSLAAQLQSLPAGILVGAESVPNDEKLLDAGLESWFEAQDLIPCPDLLGVIDRQWGGGTSALVLYRRGPGASLSALVRDGLQGLMPHLKRAVRIYLRMAAIRGRISVVEGVLDRVPWAILFVDASGRVVEMNEPARILLRRRQGLLLGGRGLSAEDERETQRLRTLLAAARHAHEPAPLGVLQLARSSGGRPLEVVVAPLPLTQGTEGEPVAAVFVGDPEAAMHPDEGLLRDLYGLTRGESALALELLRGLRLADAAPRLGIAQETARTRLKQLFAKTDTARQSELMSRLLRSPAALG
jgi:DNA-binding CsgD family transcriptional regulator